MFALRARHAGGDAGRLSVEELSLRGDDVGFGGGPGVILVLRDRDRPLVIFDRPGEQVLEQIGLAKRYIRERERGLRGKQRVCENGGVGLRARLLRLDFAPDLTPDVERPRASGFAQSNSCRHGKPRVAEPAPLTVGKSPARASLISASACR